MFLLLLFQHELYVQVYPLHTGGGLQFTQYETFYCEVYYWHKFQ